MLSWLKKNKKVIVLEKEDEEKKFIFNDTIAKEILKNIQNIYGLDYTKQEHITMKKIERFAHRNSFFSFEELKYAIKKDRFLHEKLINLLTVGETYFYRELEQIKILAEILKKNNSANILCAPCSSGEEVYSILIYLENQHFLNNHIKIKGIDINTDALKKATDGVFSARSTSQLPIGIKNRYFSKIGKLFKISSEFKRYATFEQYNIFDKNIEYLGKFDIILSRNMLIYFNDNKKKMAVEQFKKLLKNNGFLFLGHADVSFIPKEFYRYTNNYNIFKLAC